ncbi:signal recognition particle protein [Sinimarinibacterium sp. NLF-5-8]|uniref:signal recognition particle protein n=1 Tax=Sinimarinibacterium sp. NLF-5-8 TaxID=2698684 RepID=UPI00137BFC60|nr:signal recognition particle protein [Sinimarinibacterium sp. NLF-5-8]QHS11171.1 signal recognition particle protein [Sinimarinibacterium sp. NLF-5-8]
MFENLTSRLSRVLDSIRGQGRLTQEQIDLAARELRMALLEADVALPVVKDFVEQIKTRALGVEITQSLTPGQEFLRVVQQALTETLGGTVEPLNLRQQPPAIILMAGLQGAGKTTTTGKLARLLKEQEKKKVLVVSADVYRPAAIEQLRIVAEQVGVTFFPSAVGQSPVQIATDALAEARRQYADVLIVDTAGRTTVDEAMMTEIAALHAALTPVETLFVVDSMTGQDAAKTARAFADRLPLTGVILTKVDGDARGGAALSVRQVTGRPIKFLGVGEKSEKLEVFHPERIASRILGQGDMLTLIEETVRKVDHDKAQKLAEKLRKNKRFDLEDFREQMLQMQNMGSVSSLLEKLPGGAQLQAQLKNVDADKQMRRTVAIINSMTVQERRFPDVIKASRKRRIAAGSGVEVQEVNRLLRQFETTRDMMKKVASGGMGKMLRALGGRMPPGMMPRR